MSGPVHLRFVGVTLLQILLWPHLLSAQLPERVERCLPYPTLAQEIRAMMEETEPKQEQPPEIKITSVKFGRETRLSQAIRTRIVLAITRHQFYDDSKFDWLDELKEMPVKGALQDLGYFRAKVEASAHLLAGNLSRRRYSLTLRIEEGWQYRLGEIRFVNARENEPLAFSASELREHIHLRRGELFNISKIRNGMEEIRRLYGTRGYIDFTMEPETQNDDGRGPIDMLMILNEEKQYRVARIEFLGLDEKTQNQLTLELKPGDVFNQKFVDDIFKRNKLLLPSDASRKDVSILHDTKESTVDIQFDFRTCPKFEY